MQVIKAGHKIIVQRIGKEKGSSLDGSSPLSQIQAFQDWMDVKHPNWDKGKNLNKRINGGYGKFGPATTAAWSSYGDEFMQVAASIYDSLGLPSNNTSNKSDPNSINSTANKQAPATSTSTTANDATTSKSPDAIKPDDTKKDNKSLFVKISIGAGIFIVLLIIIKAFKK